MNGCPRSRTDIAADKSLDAGRRSCAIVFVVAKASTSNNGISILSANYSTYSYLPLSNEMPPLSPSPQPDAVISWRNFIE